MMKSKTPCDPAYDATTCFITSTSELDNPQSCSKSPVRRGIMLRVCSVNNAFVCQSTDQHQQPSPHSHDVGLYPLVSIRSAYKSHRGKTKESGSMESSQSQLKRSFVPPKREQTSMGAQNGQSRASD
eukprot:CCRYP_007999-RC/>CCRYP_007999-RC protein AED:0.38 eAED:0.38 QI:713/0/0.5/1/0/0/2/126/126